MKIITNTSTLSEIIAKVSKACPRKGVGIPILQYVLFCKMDAEYYLISSSDDTWVQHQIHFAEVQGEWHDFCLPIGSATSAISMLPDQSMTIDVQDELTNGSYAINFSTIGPNDKKTTFTSVALGAEEYPRWVEGNNQVRLSSIPTAALLSSIKEASKYAAADFLRPVMNGVYLDFYHDNFTIVATNGRMLYRNVFKIELDAVKEGDHASADIPVSIVPILTSCMEKEEKIEVCISDKIASFRTPDVFAMVNIYDGRYPNYNSVIPINDKFAVFNKRELVNAAKLVRNFAPESTDILCMTFDSSLFMELSSQDTDFSVSAKDTVAIVDKDKLDLMRIGVKGSSLLTCLSDIQTENVKFKLGEPNRAITIHEDDENSSVLILLMPMLLNDF